MQKEEGLLQTTIICGCYKVVKIIEPSPPPPALPHEAPRGRGSAETYENPSTVEPLN